MVQQQGEVEGTRGSPPPLLTCRRPSGSQPPPGAAPTSWPCPAVMHLGPLSPLQGASVTQHSGAGGSPWPGAGQGRCGAELNMFMGVFIRFGTGGGTGVSQARSNLCLGAEAGGDMPLQGLCGDDGDSSASLERGGGIPGGIPEVLCVCWATHPPPFPLLSHPLCHTAETQDPRTSPVQACPLPACHARCLSRSRQRCQHSHPGPPPCQMGKSPRAERESAMHCPRAGRAKPGAGSVVGHSREQRCTVIAHGWRQTGRSRKAGRSPCMVLAAVLAPVIRPVRADLG